MRSWFTSTLAEATSGDTGALPSSMWIAGSARGGGGGGVTWRSCAPRRESPARTESG
jgi:hypothetical protein